MLMHGAQPPSLVPEKTDTWRGGALGSHCVLFFPDTSPPPAIPGPDLPDLGLDRVHLPWKHLLVLSSTLCVSIWMALEVGTPGRSNSYTHFLPPLPPLIIPVNTCPGRDKGEYAGHQVHQGGSRVALVPARLPQLVQSCSTYFM